MVELEAISNALDDEAAVIEAAIEELLPSPNATAAVLLEELVREGRSYETVGDLASKMPCGVPVIALRAMRPVLTGSVAETVAEVLNREDMLIGHTPMWQGWPPESCGAAEAEA